MGVLDELAFSTRQALRWSLPAWKRVLSAEALRAELAPTAQRRLRALESATGGFARWRCSRVEWRESLYVLDLLHQLLPSALPAGRGLDVGAKNGCTLPGLATAFPRGWDLVELDAHRRYLWGSTRRAYGERLARDFEGCRFIAGNVLDQPGPWAVVTWFLPFLTPAPLEAWGLPRRFLEPERLLKHVVERLVPNGVLLVINQGEAEASLQAALFRKLGCRAEALGRVESVLSPFSRPRFGFRWTSPVEAPR
jgi:hypothetical protein